MSHFRSHFDGEYRRKPIVSIRGSSKTESREDLINRTQIERQNREIFRLKNHNAVIIQSIFRGYFERNTQKQMLRKEFEHIPSKITVTRSPFLILGTIFESSISFFNPEMDAQNLEWICNECLKRENEIIGLFDEEGDSKWFYRMAHLLRHLLLYLKTPRVNEGLPIKTLRPLTYISPETEDYNKLSLHSLTKSLLHPPFSESIFYRLLPSLHPFPFKEWVHVLKESELSSISLFYAFLQLEKISLAEWSTSEYLEYIQVLSQLSLSLTKIFVTKEVDDESDSEDEMSDSNDENMKSVLSSQVQYSNPSLTDLIDGIKEKLNDKKWTSYLIDSVVEKMDSEPVILKFLSFKPNILHKIWSVILNCKQASLFGDPPLLLNVIAKGLRMHNDERYEIVPLLAVFTSLFSFLLVTINDTEFYGNDRSWMPFTLKELTPMSLNLRDVALGLIQLAFPESRLTIREDYQLAVQSARSPSNKMNKEDPKDVTMWSHLFKIIVKLLRQLHIRDTRKQFCQDGHWINECVTLPSDRPSDISLRRSRHYQPFRGLRVFSREEMETYGPPLSAKEMRLATILREMPYVISFNQRIVLFSQLISRDKADYQGDRVNFLMGPSIDVTIRRKFIYEDALEKLSPEAEPNMKLKMRVEFKNIAGLREAGIDEDFSDLQKIKGYTLIHLYIRFTKISCLIIFFGEDVRKALYENMLVEFPLASFFLHKLLEKSSVKVDIDHLQSLDPELYRNLLYLKNYDGCVQDLGLDFTIVNEEVGTTSVEELKRNAIRLQSNAFRQGLSDVINLDWLKMFNYKELQLVISGAETEIDVSDLRNHTNYTGGYAVDHPTVVIFWNVVESMTETQKRHLLKFVTSCSRPPLLGFKELDPPFCVHNAGAEPHRLPTASTCMNLLKLPNFEEEKILKDKLLYAIESGSGFDLS
ncbi:unnamed protein product [Lepeophtheirus salmonis]|uniref:HECT-type E3 ubiquitin transferase n=1 Tax=Lepeophtheirus salmonis TaxID=72036 RepID=A0A7R8CW84_LEPSM|nr:unnamed protein product [Lepeophtheirus salmonis]CAF2951192.1 unnamed protein product [Lepeophtheirus salmonis]